MQLAYERFQRAAKNPGRIHQSRMSDMNRPQQENFNSEKSISEKVWRCFHPENIVRRILQHDRGALPDQYFGSPLILYPPNIALRSIAEVLRIRLYDFGKGQSIGHALFVLDNHCCKKTCGPCGSWNRWAGKFKHYIHSSLLAMSVASKNAVMP